MDLRTGTSFWQSLEPAAPSWPPAEGDLDCDVMILGGGISGALIGLMLARRGVSTILVDKRQPAVGSTSASTGLLQYEVDTPLSELIGKVGRERAVHAYRRGLAAIDELEAIVQEVDGRCCQFVRQNSFYYASDASDVRELQEEYECRKLHGFPVHWLSGPILHDLTSIPTPAAIHSTGNAQINPLAFTRKVLARAQHYGLRIFGDTEVVSIEEEGAQTVARTAAARITARATVNATGYEAHEMLGFKAGDLQSTYALVSEPLASRSGWPEGCLVWETARPYFYGRLTSDGRAMIGGEDTELAEDHAEPGLLSRKTEKLEQHWRQLFPDISFQTSHAWAGAFAETKDGLAYIGQVPGKRRTFAALGYGGNGITFSVIAARLIVSLYVGEENPDQAVFGFDR